MKYALATAAMVNSLGASLTVIFTLFGPERLEDGMQWIAIKVSTSTLVIAIGILTLLYLVNGIRWSDAKQALLLGGLLMVGIGSASMVWTLHLAQITNDFEGYVFIQSAGLILQGTLAAWYLFRDTFEPTIASRSQ